MPSTWASSDAMECTIIPQHGPFWMAPGAAAIMLSTLIHKYGNVSQTQGRSAKNLPFLIGDLPFVIESDLFQCHQMANNN